MSRLKSMINIEMVANTLRNDVQIGCEMVRIRNDHNPLQTNI